MAAAANHNSAPVGALSERRNDQARRSETAATNIIEHLYVHIPFCARICPYCAFYKELLDRAETPRFCKAILSELQGAAASQPPFENGRIRPTTIYFGGGTPTALTPAQLEFLLGGFRDTLDLSELREWTMEANPGSVSSRKAALLRELGVTRISLGVQSWDDDLLKLLGRDHRAEHLRESFQIVRDAGFSNINVDLMFGLPGQTLEQWRASLEQTVALKPEHISTYCLTYEEDTEFFLRHARGELKQDEDENAEFFEMTMSILEAAGFEHYEISNYARPGFRSLHNQAYWSGADYLGIGPSAFSTAGLRRWQNICDFRGYADAVLSGKSAVASVEELSPDMKRAERIALGLRTHAGTAEDLLAQFPNQTREFLRLGLLAKRANSFVLTPSGKALADSVAEAFV